MLERRWLRWLLIWLAWNLYGVLNAASFYTLSYLNTPDSKSSLTWGAALNWELIRWNLWAILTPVILLMFKRFPIERRLAPHAIFIHLLTATCFSAIHTFLLTGLSLISGHAADVDLNVFFDKFTRTFISSFLFALFIYGAIITYGLATDYYQRFREGELAKSQLQTQLAEAQLKALKMQLHPHFLFNTLNSIAALQRTDTRAAGKMIARLGDFLRMTLENTSAQEVALKEEIDFLRCYLDIELIRFGDRLKIEMEIEPETLDALVPNLVLQPIVENAIKHAIAPRSESGKLSIRAARENGTLKLQIEDDGPGLTDKKDTSSIEVRNGKGIGLKTTRARLEQLYGADYKLDLVTAAEKGLLVKVEIPYKASQVGNAHQDTNKI
jgi:sensor histidine kinase YesM